jgi:hypothetical protein
MEPTSITSHFDFESRALKSLSTFDVFKHRRTSSSFQLHGECSNTQRLFKIVNQKCLARIFKLFNKVWFYKRIDT